MKASSSLHVHQLQLLAGLHVFCAASLQLPAAASAAVEGQLFTPQPYAKGRSQVARRPHLRDGGRSVRQQGKGRDKVGDIPP